MVDFLDVLMSWFVLSMIVWATVALLPGLELRRLGSALVLPLVFGLVNSLLGWLLFVRVGFATTGSGLLLAFATHLVVNATLLKLIAVSSSSLHIRRFGHALLGAAVISLFGVATSWIEVVEHIV